jgi:hypothetical protein
VHDIAAPPSPFESPGQASHESPSQYWFEAQFATHTLSSSFTLSPKIVEPVLDEPTGHALHEVVLSA